MAGLDDAIGRSVRDAGRVSLLFSGGLDSSLLAFRLRQRVPMELVTIGTTGSRDIQTARESAELLGLGWAPRIVRRDEIHSVRSRLAGTLAGMTPVAAAVAVSVSLAVEAASEARVLCGQGADELFLGYAHFEGLAEKATEARRALDWARLVGEEWPRAERHARSIGKELRSPYLDAAFRELVFGIPISRLLGFEGRKGLLRELARRWGVPEVIAARAKRAFQYGSGVSQHLRPEAKSHRREERN